MAESKTISDPAIIAKLRWRCRRGMRELDVILSHWLDYEFEQSLPEQQSAFIALLECEDDQLWDWLTGRAEPEQPQLAGFVRILRKDDLADC